MISMVRSFGAPVIEPPGKQARTASITLTSARSCPRIVETSWCTVSYVSVTMSLGTCTLPTSQTRPRSLRTRSTIMRFSARVLSLSVSSALSRSSSAGVRPRGAVPLIGLLSAVPERSTRRNRSGDEDATVIPATFRYAAYGAGFTRRSLR